MTTLYEQDYALWSEKMADLIANKRFEEAFKPHLGVKYATAWYF